MDRTMAVEDLSQSCASCGKVAVKIQLDPSPSGYRFVFSSIGGSNGRGDEISAARAAALRAALTTPLSKEKLAAVDLERFSGFCRGCAVFYCATHWGSRAHAGAGTCPQGHFETLDPHWSPDD